MRRDPEEVRQSYCAFFRVSPPHIGNNYTSVLDERISILRKRRDVQLAVLWYRDVVADPLETFQGLVDSGWPIDPQKAVSIVDPDLCRFKLEELEVGIL